MKMDVESGMMTNLDPQSPNFNANNIKINFSVIWKLNDPKSMEAKAQIMKQKLEDDKSLMLDLANALAQNNMELARGLAILLAPRLKYSSPEKLIADMKSGSINIF
jgi:hypothetical protein